MLSEWDKYDLDLINFLNMISILIWICLQEVEDTKVIDAQVYFSSVGTGVCVLTGAYRLFFTNSITDPKVRKVAEIPGKNLSFNFF